MNDKSQIITAIGEEFNRWEDLLAGMSEEQIGYGKISLAERILAPCSATRFL